MTKKANRNDHKIPHKWENEWKTITKNCSSFVQVKIGASSESMTAGSESTEIQKQQLMPVRVRR